MGTRRPAAKRPPPLLAAGLFLGTVAAGFLLLGPESGLLLACGAGVLGGGAVLADGLRPPARSQSRRVPTLREHYGGYDADALREALRGMRASAHRDRYIEEIGFVRLLLSERGEAEVA